MDGSSNSDRISASSIRTCESRHASPRSKATIATMVGRPSIYPVTAFQTQSSDSQGAASACDCATSPCALRLHLRKEAEGWAAARWAMRCPFSAFSLCALPPSVAWPHCESSSQGRFCLLLPLPPAPRKTCLLRENASPWRQSAEVSHVKGPEPVLRLGDRPGARHMAPPLEPCTPLLSPPKALCQWPQQAKPAMP